MFHRAGTIETEFKSLGEKLDSLIAKAETAAEESNDEARQRLVELKAKRETVREKLDELRESGDEKWDILKDGIENAWSELKSAFEKMSA